MITLLDGPVGSLLPSLGVKADAPAWSADALTVAPDVVGQIHRAYATAGACVHTANTFRTKERQVGAAWQRLTRLAVEIARGAVPSDHKVAGSIAPLEDCYRPDLSPLDARPEHRAMAEMLRDAGCDLLLCETFPHVGEALVAVEEAVRTGLPVWVAFTAGPDGTLLSAEAMAGGAAEAIRLGASAVLVNCTAAALTLRYVEALARVAGGVPFGAYANAGSEADGIGGFDAGAMLDVGIAMGGGIVNGRPSDIDVAMNGGVVNGRPSDIDVAMNGGVVNGRPSEGGIAMNGGVVNGRPTEGGVAMNGGIVNGRPTSNARPPNEEPPDPRGPAKYAAFAETWMRAGATLIGSCCGTGPAHIAHLSQTLLKIARNVGSAPVPGAQRTGSAPVPGARSF